MSMYDNTARFYDVLMADVDYPGYAAYIHRLFQKFMKTPPSSVVDLACGTGTLTLELHRLGYDMTGVDVSREMLSKAHEKNNKDILWINQDISRLNLYGTVDAAVCFLDGINHITEARRICRLMRLVYTFLNPGGVFVFDVNTRFKFEHVYANNVFYEIDQDVSYIWENTYHSGKGTCRMDITYFMRNENGCYSKHEDSHVQRVYEIKELEHMASEAGFRVKGVFNDKTLRKAGEDTERAFLVIKKEEAK
ncbi:MAG: methyltransferase domain-containing protein [Clostridia bacterium]